MSDANTTTPAAGRTNSTGSGAGAPSRPAAPRKAPTPPPSRAEAARAAATRALENARDSAGDAARRASDGIEANPIAALAGGIALGVVAGLVAPRSDREAEAMLPLGRKLREGVAQAGEAALEAGKAELAEVGISRIGANEQVGKVIEGLGRAVASAGAAAKEARRRK